MSILEEILTRYDDESFLKADGFDEAIIGVDEERMRLVYSISKCVEILTDSMSEAEAIDYVDYNILGGYVGPNTPIFCRDNFN